VCHQAPLKLAVTSRNNNICALWQWATNRLEGLASHNDWMSSSGCAETTHILLDIPQQGVLIAYHAILSNGNNN
jgi:hypothetical protein